MTAVESRAFGNLRQLLIIAPYISLILGTWAQAKLDSGFDLAEAAVAFFVAAALFAIATRAVAIENETRANSQETASARVHFAVVAFALSVVAFLSSGGNLFRPIGVAAWLGSIFVFLYAITPKGYWRGVWARVRTITIPKTIDVQWQTLALAVIVFVGAFFRFYRLDEIPAEMGPDLPLKFDNVNEILNGNFLVFFPSHPGREALFFYWTAIIAKIFGLSHFTIKASAALIGTLTIPTLYLIAKRIYNAEVGLYAALILAINHYHIIQSRIGFRAILIPLFTFVLLYLMTRIFRNGRWVDFAWAGLWVGLGLYTYNAWLVAPIAFVISLTAYWIGSRALSLWVLARGIVLAGFGALLVWAPLARYGFENPQMYLLRVTTRVEGEGSPPGNVTEIFLDNLRRTFLMLNFRGDSVFIQNVPFMRELGFITAILFVLGVGYALIRWRQGYHALVLSLFAMMLLPSALSIAFPAEVPNVNRSAGGIGMAILLAAFPLALMRQQLADAFTQLRHRFISRRVALSHGPEVKIEARFAQGASKAWIIPVLAIILFIGEARASFKTYFTDYVSHLPAHNYSISRNLARALDDFAGNGAAYLKIFPNWYDGNAVRVQLRKMPRDGYRELGIFDVNQAPFQNFAGRAMFLLSPLDKDALAFMREFFPDGVMVEQRDPDGVIEIVTFYGEKK